MEKPTIKEIQEFYDNAWSEKRCEGWRVKATIFEFLKIKEADLTLEIGCGEGSLTEKLSKKYKEIIACDISSVGVRKARNRVEPTCNSQFLMCDATKLPFKSNVFDLVILSEVLEHLLDRKKCVEEMTRVIRHDGCLILTTPNRMYRDIEKLVYKVLGKTFTADQIVDNQLLPSTVRQMLAPFFTIEKERGVFYTIPYLDWLGSQFLMKIRNHISDFIEERSLLPNFGQHYCVLCRHKS